MQADRWKGMHTKFCSITLLENDNLQDRYEDGTRFIWRLGKCSIRVGL